jgi:hypothetical protein
MKWLFSISFVVLLSCNSVDHETWPGGKIPFVLVGMNADEAKEIYRCMLLWEFASKNRVEFIFKKNTGDKFKKNNILYIIKDTQLSGSIGTGYFPNSLNLIFLNKIEQRAILHELGHRLGLDHEHQRPDRDFYITIITKNIEPGTETQFIYMKPDLYDYSIYPYDYQSIMHYGLQDTSAIDPHGHEIGSDIISAIDAMKVQDMYDPDMNK